MSAAGKETFVMGAVSLLSNKFAGFCDNQLGDVTYRQWFLLMMIQRMGDGEKSLAQIADFTGTSRQNVKHMATTLEQRGYLAMTPSTTDRRATSVSLTRKGKYLLTHRQDALSAETERLFEPLSPTEVDSLAVGLQKLLLAVDAYEG